MSAAFDDLEEAARHDESPTRSMPEPSSAAPASSVPGADPSVAARKASSSLPPSPDSATAAAPWITDVVASTTALMSHLHCLNMQLAQFRQRCGAGIAAGFGSGGGSSSILSLLERGSVCISEKSGHSWGHVMRSGVKEGEQRGGPSGLAVTKSTSPKDFRILASPKHNLNKSASVSMAEYQPLETTPSSPARSLHDELERFRMEQMSPLDRVKSWKDNEDLEADHDHESASGGRCALEGIEAASSALATSPAASSPMTPSPIHRASFPALEIILQDQRISERDDDVSTSARNAPNPSTPTAVPVTAIKASDTAPEAIDATSPLQILSTMTGLDMDDGTSSIVPGGAATNNSYGGPSTSSMLGGQSAFSWGGAAGASAASIIKAHSSHMIKLPQVDADTFCPCSQIQEPPDPAASLASRPFSDPVLSPTVPLQPFSDYLALSPHLAGSQVDLTASTTADECGEVTPRSLSAASCLGIGQARDTYEAAATPTAAASRALPVPIVSLSQPSTPATATAAAASSGWPAVLHYGHHSLTLSKEECRALRSHSGLLRAWTAAARRQALHTVLKVWNVIL